MYKTEIVGRQQITPKKAIIELEKPAGYYHKAGEHLKVKIGDDERPYSIGSPPEDGVIRLFVKQLEDGSFAEEFLEKEVGDTVEITDSEGEYVYQGEERVLLLSTGMGAAPNIAIKEHIMETRNSAQAGVVNICPSAERSFYGDVGHQIYKDIFDNPVEEMLEWIKEDRYDKIYFCGNSDVGEKVEEKAEEIGIPVESVKY